MNPEAYMNLALEEAKSAYQKDEVPIGAIIVDPISGEIISRAHNLSEHVADATAHAEIIAIQNACKKLDCNRLRDFDMYVTLEPCTMCAAAISFARIKNLFIGAPDPKGGGVINGVKFYDQPTCHHRPNIHVGIMQEECSQILKDFFKAKRKK